MSIKTFSAFFLFFIHCAFLARSQEIDTLSAYKYLKDSSTYQLIFDDNNILFNTDDPNIFESFKKAMRRRMSAIVEYDTTNNSIKRITLKKQTKQEIFEERFDTLDFIDFKFKKFRSLDWNQEELFEELEQIDTARKEIPASQVAEIFDRIKFLSCVHRKNCSRNIPCIPFDYKANGCNARAHWIKKILAEEFGFTCNKIFTEGRLIALNDGNCGKTCVCWGWHVAVLVKVIQENGEISESVIDPSLFQNPVSIPEWENAQRSSCSNRQGNITETSIRGPHVWTPNGSTDLSYEKTKNLLYKFCNKCH